MAQFETDFLSMHNAYRKRHGSPPLQLSRELCNSAQRWANYLLSIRTMKHSKWGYGENIYYCSGHKELKGRKPVDRWYDEIQYYNYSRPGFAMNTGHFTQVVWKDSKQLGVGVATDGRGTFYVVGQYSPAGNRNCPGLIHEHYFTTLEPALPFNITLSVEAILELGKAFISNTAVLYNFFESCLWQPAGTSSGLENTGEVGQLYLESCKNTCAGSDLH
ncbi:Golgi-associated plant pathogenesis-related protein 1-like [Bombina bombina]|uniref:Golgi-associated plant pathogenesis-related protein 1-like n=1 Tax=Bombina bombina TaxID=8345 RepID=UPI00235A7DAE|nr:Golgi-associated plant pathogenesis-related protein 1-like [Bombina bombina]